ncbi:hypothetical protein [Saliterribacillus persicus]|uniref:Uncharacterized protein n=1 Tax=Saliterribacillus persicus TaxID=930114 RepID=A0A368Y9V1_9BACI|nr:hypothetical protein [Saliterribacillus persicus]RCW77050.1 hypothetical protein DFR57_102326 [Saliterribacillus persicus]
MKRFLILMVSLLLIIAFGYYLYYVEGYYIDFEKESAISTPFYIEKDVIYHQQEEAGKPFVIRGVEVDSSYGPKRGTDFSIEEQTWLRWFEMIQQMGANTIRASKVYDPQFYHALYQYNKDQEQPLYLLQGMQVMTDEVETNKNKENLAFYQTLTETGRNLVDIIHGRKVMLANEHEGSGVYRYDVSPWVIGFVIGDEWNQDLLAYIDQTLDPSAAFNGNYVTTTSEATTFEVMMAEIIEDIVVYESRKYDTQRPVSVNSALIMDPFKYQEIYARQVGKYNTFTIDHIKPTAEMKAGLFASYAYEELEYEPLPLIATEEKIAYPDVSDYFDLLYQAHEVPVVITSVGYPSASYFNHEGKQETQIIDHLKRFDAVGFNGVVIRSWQDVWDRRTLETSYAVDLQQINDWHDPLTSTQHFGLIGFKPYRDQVLMSVDGEKDDWQDGQETTENVSMTRDHAYLYLWLEDRDLHAEEPIYIAFDLHPELGSKNPDVFDLTFDREMDFFIKVEPNQEASIYVQDRYQGVRQHFLERVTGENPYIHYPNKDSNTFEPVNYVKHKQEIFTEEEMNELETRVYQYSFEPMSRLTPSMNNQAQEADVAIDDGRIEIRVPYQLLNLYDPLKFTIHDDYYQHYGVEPFQIDHFYVSVANRHKTAISVKIPVQPIEELERVEEYIKPAYHAVQTYWEGED